ncbi:MAG: ATP-binding protein [Leptospiraceae bacterium]|nr:ATP-binding protein [Leptospiraceae bacterium]
MHLIIQNNMTELDRVRDALTNALQGHCDRLEINRIILAVDEALSNILEHAYPPESCETVEMSVELADARITVMLKDRGNFFDPTQMTPVNTAEEARNNHDGGLGVFLFTTLMEVSHQARPNGGNILTMSRQLSPCD